MLKRAFLITAVFVLCLATLPRAGQTSATTSVRVDSQLKQFFATHATQATVPVVITYKQKPGPSEFSRLQLAGITKGFAARELPMIICDMNAAQLLSASRQPGVVSIYSNRLLKLSTNVSRPFIGVPQMQADAEVTKRNTSNTGQPITGKGVGIGYVDTGIDATHADLAYGTKTVQNVVQPLSETTVSDAGLVVGTGVDIGDLVDGTGFVPPVYLENQHTSDLESGHGTFGSAVAAGTGAASGGFYGGVAKGAQLVGVNSGNDMGLPLVAIIGAYDYLLSNQYAYNIRVINNSWGSTLDADGIDPNNPINVATRIAHDRNITVVFAAGNDGDTPTSINPYSTMPWTISVAAGEKQGLGSPAGFSSRGVDDGTGTDVAGMPADPTLAPNLRPDITAPGVDIKSARMKGVGVVNTAGTVPVFVGSNDATTIAPAYLPYYTTSQGTSFACPHVSGVVALMIEANPLLTPDDVVTILRQTANPMPYDERVVGAGYVDAHNAVRASLSLAPVAHAFNLMPDAGGPEIVDPAGDQTGTNAQDILSADFAYDPAANQIVYTLTLADASARTPNSTWTMSSIFNGTTVFVSASVDETGALVYEYGHFETLPNGTPNQTSDGAPDSAQIAGNQIIVRVGVDRINTIAGSNVVGTTSTGTSAQAQILVGTSATGGLLLNADSATGRDFVVR
ncbi:MAG TPA: S8 family serine peptidase [Pyrinomonadaceae bacterium]|nr:S8 family serine peptidase [Pyrinomonadaceae bacterium]